MAKKARSTQESVDKPMEAVVVPRKIDLSRFIQRSDLGIVVKKSRDALLEFALQQPNPMEFLEAQAAAVQESLDAGLGPPELPIEDAIGSPRALSLCPTSGNHKDIHCWAIGAGRRRRFICNDCGSEWATM